MSKTTDIRTSKTTGDVVLQEIWHIKETLSASYGHDVKRLFAETRKREKPRGALQSTVFDEVSGNSERKR